MKKETWKSIGTGAITGLGLVMGSYLFEANSRMYANATRQAPQAPTSITIEPFSVGNQEAGYCKAGADVLNNGDIQHYWGYEQGTDSLASKNMAQWCVDNSSHIEDVTQDLIESMYK